MGSENSKPSTSNNDYQNRLAMQRALEQQRRIYEAKYEEFIQSQKAIQESINRQNSSNRNNTHQPTASTSNYGSSTSTTLYPNLHNRNSVQVTTNSNNNLPSTSNNVYQSTTPKTSTTPAATVSSIRKIPSAPPTLSNVSAPPTNVGVPRPTTNVGVPPNNNNEGNNTINGAILKNRSTTPKTSTIPAAAVSSIPIIPSAPSTLSNVSAPPTNVGGPPNNNNEGNNTNKGAIPKNRSTTPKTSTIPAATVSSIPIIPSAPSTLSNVSAPPTNVGGPPNNNNEGNNTNKGAIPKNRRKQNAQKKTALMGVECVTCKGEFGLQIFQCENGHSSCSGCRFTCKVCGLCSKTITDIRNITLEATLADIIVKQGNNTERTKCYNAKDGCSLSFPIKEMENHLKECPFNDIKCPLSALYQNCTWKGKINQLSIHFNDVHPQHCVADVDTEMALLNINISQKITYFVKIGPFNFLIHIKVDGTENVLYMTAQLFGTKVSASKWTYELHVYNKREPQRKFAYTDDCYSHSESVNGIFNRAQCAAISLQYVETFVNNGLLNYKFFLKKKIDNKRN